MERAAGFGEGADLGLARLASDGGGESLAFVRLVSWLTGSIDDHVRCAVRRHTGKEIFPRIKVDDTMVSFSGIRLGQKLFVPNAGFSLVAFMKRDDARYYILS